MATVIDLRILRVGQKLDPPLPPCTMAVLTTIVGIEDGTSEKKPSVALYGIVDGDDGPIPIAFETTYAMLHTVMAGLRGAFGDPP